MQTSIDFNRVLSELRENLRLRLGIALAIVIILVWISLVLRDFSKEGQRKLDKAHSELADVLSIEDQSFWEDQLNVHTAASQKAGVKIWRDRSPSLLAASLQSKLYSMAGEMRVLSPEIKTSSHERVFRDGRLFRLKASVRGYFKGTDGVAFIDKIESHSPVISIESMSIKTTPRKNVNNRIDLIVIIYFNKDPAP